MSMEGDCSSLFESLKSIQCSQKKFKNFSDELLQMLIIEADNENDKNELNANKQEGDVSIHKLAPELNKKREENVSVVNFTGFDESESKIIHDKDIVQSFQSHDKENITSNKLPYLKKGQGLSRFNYKMCKGFKKKNSDAKNSKNSNEIEKIAASVIPNEYQDKRHNNFEKLEELVENDSFCSTSSKVLGLLQGTVLEYSSPISRKVFSNNSPVKSQEPITVRETSKDYHCHRSPVKKLYSGQQTTFFLANNHVQTCSDKEVQAWKKIENSSNNVDNTPVFSSSQRFISGILKKSNIINIKKSNSKIDTPLFTKVKFLEQGVNVLEYENDENVTICSGDSDLVSSSDIENLISTNFVPNPNVEDSLGNSFIGKDNYFPLTERNEKSQSTSGNSLKSKTLLCKNKFEVGDIDTSPQQNFTNVENLREKDCKMLLLAKIHELDKEINKFKRDIKCLENIKKLVEKPVPEKRQNSFPCENCAVLKSKIKDTRHSAHKEALSPQASLQVQKLTKELINLKREYNLLLRKEDLKLRMPKSDVKNVNECKTNIRANKCKSVMKKVSDKTDIKNVCGSSRTTRGHGSYQSQNMNTKSVSFSSITHPMISIEKAPIMSVSKNSSFCTITTATTTTSHHERPLLEHDSQKTDDFTLPEITGEVASNAISVLGKNTEIPQNSSMIPLNLPPSSGEKCQGTNTSDVLEDFATKKDNIKSITSIETNNSSLAVVENKSPPNIHCSRMTSESFKVPSLKVKTSENKKMKLKPSEKVFIPKPDLIFTDLIEINDNVKSEPTTIEREDCNILNYPNGDREIKYSNKSVYYYTINNSTRTFYTDEGREELEFANGQKEIYYSDGSYEVIFPDSSSQTVYADGTEIYLYQNGTKIQINKDKTKIIHFSNGQKEIYKSDSTWRVYPDGTTKILYKDGSEETRYLNGKIRFKEADGTVRQKVPS